MAKKFKQKPIPEVLVFTDTNHYPDALASLVVLSWLADHNLIKVRGLITEVGPYEVRRRRAMYAKGALVKLDQAYWRVAPGGDYLPTDDAEERTYPENELTSVFENAGTAVLRSGTMFLQEYIKSAPEKNVYLLLNAPFSDLAKYIKTAGAALAKKLKKIVVMGSVLPQKDENGHTRPDMESYNFKIGAPAAEELFEYVRAYGIRMAIVPAQTVNDLNMGYEFLEGLSKSKNPVAQQLLADRCDNPSSMHYDMLSVLATADSEFKRSGGVFESVADEPNLFVAKVANPVLIRDKFMTIFKDKLAPKKITLGQLMRSVEEKTDVSNA